MLGPSLEDSPERAQERRRLVLQLLKAVLDNLVYEFLADLGQRQEYGPAVCRGTIAAQQAALGEPASQFHGTVMLNLELLGELLDRGLLSLGETLDGEQEFVLLGLESDFFGGLPPSAQEACQLMTEFR